MLLVKQVCKWYGVDRQRSAVDGKKELSCSYTIKRSPARRLSLEALAFSNRRKESELLRLITLHASVASWYSPLEKALKPACTLTERKGSLEIFRSWLARLIEVTVRRLAPEVLHPPSMPRRPVAGAGLLVPTSVHKFFERRVSVDVVVDEVG